MRLENGRWTEVRQPPTKFWETLHYRLERNPKPIPDFEQKEIQFLNDVASDDQIKLAMLRYLSDESVSVHTIKEFVERFYLAWNQLDDKFGEWWWRYYDEDDPQFKIFDKRAKELKKKYGRRILYLDQDDFAKFSEFLDNAHKNGIRPEWAETDYEWLVERDPDVASAMLLIELSESKLGIMLSPEQIKILPDLVYAVEGFKDQRSHPLDNSHEWTFRTEVVDLLKKAV